LETVLVRIREMGARASRRAKVRDIYFSNLRSVSRPFSTTQPRKFDFNKYMDSVSSSETRFILSKTRM